MRRHLAILSLVALLLPLAGCGSSSHAPTASAPPEIGPVVLTEDLVGRRLFTADSPWYVDVSSAPLDSSSAAYVDFLSGRAGGYPYAVQRLGQNLGPPGQGIPYVVVSGEQPLIRVHFVEFGSESDSAAPGRPPGYPIPEEAKTEPNYVQEGVPGGGTSGDRHMLIVDRDHWLLYELYGAHWNADAGAWEASSGAAYDLSTEPARPAGWTSADGAGMAILPGLVRYDEVAAEGEITHAFRVSARGGTNGHVWPASHTTGSVAGAPPMGTRLRLKASVDLSPYPAPMQKIFRAMKRYGLIVADDGNIFAVTGTMDPRWQNSILDPALRAMTVDSFEVVKLGWGQPTR